MKMKLVLLGAVALLLAACAGSRQTMVAPIPAPAWPEIAEMRATLGFSRQVPIRRLEADQTDQSRYRERIYLAPNGYMFYESVKPYNYQQIDGPTILLFSIAQDGLLPGLVFSHGEVKTTASTFGNMYYAAKSANGRTCYAFLVFLGDVSRGDAGDQLLRGGSCESDGTTPERLAADWLDLINSVVIGKSRSGWLQKRDGDVEPAAKPIDLPIKQHSGGRVR